MAVEFTPTVSVFGDQRVVYGTLTMTGVTSGAVSTGLEVINGGSIVPQSQASGVPVPLYHFNRNSAGAASNGMIQIQSCTAGDTFNIFCFGK